jgi:hypothetical protein
MYEQKGRKTLEKIQFGIRNGAARWTGSLIFFREPRMRHVLGLVPWPIWGEDLQLAPGTVARGLLWTCRPSDLAALPQVIRKYHNDTVVPPHIHEAPAAIKTMHNHDGFAGGDHYSTAPVSIPDNRKRRDSQAICHISSQSE